MTLTIDCKTLNAILNNYGGWAGFPPTTFDTGDGEDGDVTISSNTNLTSVLDGDAVIKQYRNLTIDAGKILSVTNPCKGLIIKVMETLTLNGTISMNGLGATSTEVQTQKKNMVPLSSIWQLNDWFNREMLMGKVPPLLTYTIPDTGGTFGGGASYTPGGCTQTYTGHAGYPGSAGTNGKCGGGGGGGGGSAWGNSGAGGNGGTGNGGGGGGGGGGSGGSYPCEAWSSGGGGASGCTPGAGSAGINGAGDGGQGGRGGGILIVIANIIAGSGGALYANGTNGTLGTDPGGGGARGGTGGAGGGGSILLIYRQKSQTVTLQANGGTAPGSDFGGAGGAGGAGSIRQYQFSYT